RASMSLRRSPSHLDQRRSGVTDDFIERELWTAGHRFESVGVIPRIFGTTRPVGCACTGSAVARQTILWIALANRGPDSGSPRALGHHESGVHRTAYGVRTRAVVIQATTHRLALDVRDGGNHRARGVLGVAGGVGETH